MWRGGKGSHTMSPHYALKRRVLVLLSITISVLATACVQLDHFSGQATEFNVQVADAQNKTLLLNIVRAANRLPMHFTELSTLSGTSTVTSGGTLLIPFATFRSV